MAQRGRRCSRRGKSTSCGAPRCSLGALATPSRATSFVSLYPGPLAGATFFCIFAYV